jgi:gliding motility-associated lipoprotein GldJ
MIGTILQQQHVQSFYMDETEVTNFMYLVFRLVENVFPPSESYKYIYEGASPDTLVWRNRLGYNETMTNNYLRHPVYKLPCCGCKLDSSCRV